MANYRFKTAEIEAMKENVLTHIEREAETKTAWRLRCAIEGQLMCCRPSKREAARLERELALYEKLTKNDLPNWQSEPTQPATPTETPQIVRVEIVRDFDSTYYANLFDESGGSHNLSKEYTDYRTLKTLCKKEYGVNLPNLSQIEFETHGRKSYAYISTETPRISTETAETVNVSAEGENAENEPIKHISDIMETCRTWDYAKRDYTDEYKYYTWLANHIPEHKATNKNTTELILEEVQERISAAATLVAHGIPKCDIEGAVCAVVNRLAKMDDILQFCKRAEPPQSPTTPTDKKTIKPQEEPRQTAQKEPKRTIQISLIVQRPQSVIRKFRTTPAYHFCKATKMIVPRFAKNVPRGCSTGWSPPIRGDCKVFGSIRQTFWQTPPNTS